MSTEQPSVPAATVVLLRDGAGGLEVLLLQRAGKLAFHAGAWVFPGGRVDPADAGVDALHTARHAAVREVREEAGLTVEAADLVPISHWTTPPGQVRRFATWFFTAAVDPAAAVTVDGVEITGHRWLTPGDALAEQARGQLPLPPPTFVTLTVLGAFASAQAFVAEAAGGAPAVFVPKLVPVDGGAVSLYEGDAGYATGDPAAGGARHRLEMVEAGWRYLRA